MRTVFNARLCKSYNGDLNNISQITKKVNMNFKNIYIFFEKGIAFSENLWYNSRKIDLRAICAPL